MYDATNGPWANRSAEFVRTAYGNVECIVPNAKSDRTWSLTEVPNLMDSNLTNINGIPKQDLLSTNDLLIHDLGYSEENAMNTLRDILRYKSRIDMSQIDVFKGENGILGVDTSGLTGESSISTPEGTLEKVTL